MPIGHVFVISTASRAATARLVRGLADAQIDVVTGQAAHSPGSGVSNWHMIETAAAIIMAWGTNGADAADREPTVATAFSAGILVPVLLESPLPPPPFRPQDCIDLHDWTAGDSHPEFARLLDVLQELSARRHGRLYQAATNLQQDWPVIGSQQTLSRLQDLTDRVGRLGDLLSGDSRHTADMISALDEIGATYEAVNDALARFLTMGGSPAVTRSAVHQLARQSLMERIHNGRGSCTRIERIYRRVGGLRDALEDQESPPVIAEADDVFSRFATADGDMFAELEQLGDALTNEARAVEGLLITGQEDAAERRIAAGYQRLLPLETSVTQARSRLRQIQERLGYAKTSVASEAVTVNVRTINIGGGTFNGPVVIADIIERSTISATSAPSGELSAALTQLAAAVAAMTTKLPEDEGELAARDLEELTRLATSGEDKPAMWRRAVDGLLGVAKRTAEVGVPVVELVAKVVQLAHGG